MNKIYCIGVQYGNAGHIRGAEIGARLLKNYMMQEHQCLNGGDITDYSSSTNKEMECLNEVSHTCNIIKTKIYNYLKKDNYSIIIGGDHSISLGSISGVNKFAALNNLNLGVIYIDAHGDINTDLTSSTHNIHGMTLAAAMGFGNQELTKVTYKKIIPQNVLLIGTRSLDKGEHDLIRKNNIPIIPSHEILKQPTTTEQIDYVLKEVNKHILHNKLDIIHLSVDVDVVDPLYAPGTGVPEPHGLTPQCIGEIINSIMNTNMVKTIDLVEYNPSLDLHNITFNVCKSFLNIICEYWKI